MNNENQNNVPVDNQQVNNVNNQVVENTVVNNTVNNVPPVNNNNASVKPNFTVKDDILIYIAIFLPIVNLLLMFVTENFALSALVGISPFLFLIDCFKNRKQLSHTFLDYLMAFFLGFLYTYIRQLKVNSKLTAKKSLLYYFAVLFGTVFALLFIHESLFISKVKEYELSGLDMNILEFAETYLEEFEFSVEQLENTETGEKLDGSYVEFTFTYEKDGSSIEYYAFFKVKEDIVTVASVHSDDDQDTEDALLALFSTIKMSEDYQ